MKSDPVSSSFSALLYDQLREPSNQEPPLARDAAFALSPRRLRPGPVKSHGGFGIFGFGPSPTLPTSGFGPDGPGLVVPSSSTFVSATPTA